MNYGSVSSYGVSQSGGFGGGYLTALQSCCTAADDALDHLDAASETLSKGTDDVDRLAKIVHSTRLYVLIDEPTLDRIKSEVSDAVVPQMEKLIEQGEKALANLEKSSTSLQKKADNLQNRLTAQPAGDQHAGAPLHVRNEIRKTKLLIKQEKMLQNELDTLQNEIDDLELQAITHKTAPGVRTKIRTGPLAGNRNRH
ncbi:hypothetical protein FRB94_000183 [Tulasnella sp. JGI-2019a]|nr:hypothetical protein FRB94_000183 [Tulasnella sp. JGI-2019a]KAG9015866.1 hypothetical protein FRB93_012431 [Tulasnella sp. JGI-2019a]KAG9039501.1 hypothetical protein FRB95_009081 [Tulasnella sp. JGI-2019a]